MYVYMYVLYICMFVLYISYSETFLFQIKKNTVAAREKNRTKIMKALKSELVNVHLEQEYYVLMPGLECHQYHAADVVVSLVLDCIVFDALSFFFFDLNC